MVYIGYIDLAHIRYISNWQSGIELSYRRLLNKHSIELPIARYETHLNIDQGQTSIKRHS